MESKDEALDLESFNNDTEKQPSSSHADAPKTEATLPPVNPSDNSASEGGQDTKKKYPNLADFVTKMKSGSKTANVRTGSAEVGFELGSRNLDARPSSADDINKINPRQKSAPAGFFKRQQSTMSTRSSTAKQIMMKETKKFFGLDECSQQAQLWEERRRRHACRSNGPLKVDVPKTPGINNQTHRVPATSFRSAAQTIIETPSTSAPPPPPQLSLVSTVHEASRLSSPREKKASDLKVDIDTAFKSQMADVAERAVSSPTPESYICSDIATEDEDVFDSRQSLTQAYHQRRINNPEPNSRRESVARITWDTLTSVASRVVQTKRRQEVSPTARVRSPRLRTVRPEEADLPAGPRAAYTSPNRQSPYPIDPLLKASNDFDIQSNVIQSDVDYVPTQLDPAEGRFTRWKKQIAAKVFDRDIYKSNSFKVLKKVLGKKTDETWDDLSDYRPYFTYWVTTVQLIVMILVFATYERASWSLSLHSKSSLVLMASLSRQNVQFWEASNLWFGPRPADLIRLGAKYTPCMRNDIKIQEKIESIRKIESSTGCCIRNDKSGCVQSHKEQCSERLSVWTKWSNESYGPDARTSGAVCGQDPRYCKVPASISPHIWSDDISKWPICVQQGNIASAEEHMTCENIARPCCIGIHGECRIVTQEYCDFVKGTFHEEATLCSQISCLNELCGLISFYNPERPDQIYRLWLSLFIHAGAIHLCVTIILQYIFMRNLEKLTGPVRIGIIYTLSGIAGNLASAIFEPHKPEVGPGGAHFGLLACLFVELKNNWSVLETPARSLIRLICVAIFLFLLGFLPWVDCWAHLFGFICGLLLSFALLPFVYEHKGEDAPMWKVVRILSCLFSVLIIIAVLFVLFYVTPIHDCKFCDVLNCIPFTKDFCAEQKIDYNKEFDIL